MLTTRVNFRKYDVSASGIGGKGKARENNGHIAGKALEQFPFEHFLFLKT